MSDALSATGLFPPSFVIEIETAELSGTDAEAMHHLAAQYDERAAAATKALAGIASMVVRVGAFLLILTVGHSYVDHCRKQLWAGASRRSEYLSVIDRSGKL